MLWCLCASSSSVVHCWPSRPMNCLESQQIGHFGGASAEGGNCAPQVAQTKAVLIMKQLNAICYVGSHVHPTSLISCPVCRNLPSRRLSIRGSCETAVGRNRSILARRIAPGLHRHAQRWTRAAIRPALDHDTLGSKVDSAERR